LLISIYLLFINKNTLTIETGWFKRHVMNANEVSPKGDVRLRRIKKVTRILKVCVLFYYLIAPLVILAFNFKTVHLATGTVSVFNHPYASAGDIPAAMKLLLMIGAGIFIFGVISFYRLLNLYEKGMFFSKANVSEMKKLGSVVTGYGILTVVADVVYEQGIIIFPTMLSPWIVVGAAIYVVAWIMDEGRKIQEEQALTV
jgi:hypothetical protein